MVTPHMQLSEKERNTKRTPLTTAFIAFREIEEHFRQHRFEEALRSTDTLQKTPAITSSKSLWTRYWHRKILILVEFYEACSGAPLQEWHDLYRVARESTATPFFTKGFPRTRDERRADRLLENARSEARRLFVEENLAAPPLELAKFLYIDEKYTEAFPIFLKLAQEGDPDAQGYLGSMYGLGLGIPKNPNEAVQWFIRAAEQGDRAAQWVMGYNYARGYGVPRDYTKAAEYYKKAAEQGFDPAQFSLGLLYAKGKGVEKDAHKAATWCRKAAEQGNREAQYYLGRMYEDGYGVDKDVSKATEWVLHAAHAGDEDAQLRIGLMYMSGTVVPPNMRVAAKWLQRAANQGSSRAQYHCGQMYKSGHGVPQDMSKAVKWLRKAAGQGDADAQYSLGQMYATGYGVTRDSSRAKALLQKASDQGHTGAQKKVPPAPFPPPPVPGNEHIQPLTTPAMLQEEGKAMHHCVGSYSGVVRTGKRYVYRILKPARATVEISKADNGTWDIHQLKSYCNASPSLEVFEMVREWLDLYSHPPGGL